MDNQFDLDKKEVLIDLIIHLGTSKPWIHVYPVYKCAGIQCCVHAPHIEIYNMQFDSLDDAITHFTKEIQHQARAVDLLNQVPSLQEPFILPDDYTY